MLHAEYFKGRAVRNGDGRTPVELLSVAPGFLLQANQRRSTPSSELILNPLRRKSKRIPFPTGPKHASMPGFFHHQPDTAAVSRPKRLGGPRPFGEPSGDAVRYRQLGKGWGGGGSVLRSGIRLEGTGRSYVCCCGCFRLTTCFCRCCCYRLGTVKSRPAVPHDCKSWTKDGR